MNEQADPGAFWAKSLQQLRDLSDDELVQQHDQIARGKAVVQVDYYLRELARRDADRQTRAMVRLTWVIAALTAVNVAVVFIAAVGN